MEISLQEIRKSLRSSAIDIMPLTEAGREWQEYLESHDNADICHSRQWGNIYAAAFGLRSYLVVHRSDGQIDGGIPLIAFDQWSTGCAFYSMPFLNYGGVVANDIEIAREILTACRGLLSVCRAKYIEMRHKNYRLEGLSDVVRENRVTFHLNIDRPPDSIFPELKKQLRTRIRNSEKKGLDHYRGNERLHHFYPLFATAMREHGTPVMPRRFFESVLRQFPENAEILLAYKDNRPVGGKILLKFKNRITMTWGCYPNKYKPLLANYFLTWKLIEYYAQSEFKVLDFGRSPYDSGGFTYKANWGTEQVPIYTEYIAGDVGDIPDLKPENKKYKMAIALWKRLPLPLTRVLGPRIVRYFP